MVPIYKLLRDLRLRCTRWGERRRVELDATKAPSAMTDWQNEGVNRVRAPRY